MMAASEQEAVLRRIEDLARTAREQARDLEAHGCDAATRDFVERAASDSDPGAERASEETRAVLRLARETVRFARSIDEADLEHEHARVETIKRLMAIRKESKKLMQSIARTKTEAAPEVEEAKNTVAFYRHSLYMESRTDFWEDEELRELFIASATLLDPAQ
eukprot:m51a1_g11309 hypothetical protein (163) ;mRNA; r:88624-89382